MCLLFFGAPYSGPGDVPKQPAPRWKIVVFEVLGVPPPAEAGFASALDYEADTLSA